MNRKDEVVEAFAVSWRFGAGEFDGLQLVQVQ